MGKISNRLTFCFCLEKVNHAELIEGHQWTLDRYIGSKGSRLLGKLMIPSDLDNEIKIQDIIQEMNKRNCFDFDYKPKERDCFKINNGLEHPDYKYFSLIFKNGVWEKGSNPSFGRTISENIAKGKVKLTRNIT